MIEVLGVERKTPYIRRPHKRLQAKTVQLTVGNFTGNTVTSNGLVYHRFNNIPYALLPTDALRFAPPVKVVRLSDYYEHLTFHNKCEDPFLGVHIYTPQLKQKPDQKFRRPVIVYVPGAYLFEENDALDYVGPEYLLQKDVVLVVVCYRSGIFGFTRFEDEKANAPGDVGLQDLKMAFNWVKREIGTFGGNPDNITAYGQGLGAFYLRQLLKSSHFTLNLFHKAILSSILYNRVAETDEKGRFFGTVVARNLHYTRTPDDDIPYVEHLRSIPAYMIKNFDREMFYLESDRTLQLNELLEHDDETYKYKVPVMIGYNSQEGMLEVMMFRRFSNAPFLCFAHKLLHSAGLAPPMSKEKSFKLAEKVTHYYLKVLKPKDEYFALFTDINQYLRIMATIRIMAQRLLPAPVFFYRFEVDLRENLMKRHLESVEKRSPTEAASLDPFFKALKRRSGAYHGDELGYIFKRPGPLMYEEGSKEEKIVDRMTTLWTQFARNNNPNPKDDTRAMRWKPIKSQLRQVYNISNTNCTYQKIPERKTMSFWEKIYCHPFFSKNIYLTKRRFGKKRNVMY